jgi:predicted metal-binding membrane protein
VVEREPDGAGGRVGVASVVDTPRAAYSVLERRATVLVGGILIGLAGVAWLLTAERSEDMAGMVQGLAQVGGEAMFDMAAPVFMVMWVTMMVAMMFPTIAPIVLLHRLVVRRQGGGVVPSVCFVGGYLLVWTVAGLVPLALLLASREITVEASLVGRAAGAVIALAGAYQFTRWKQTCMRACRSPLTFLATHDFGVGRRGTVRAGVSHGAFCLGCCWALMAVLFTVGLMNLAWMALLSVVFLAEKNWSRGPLLVKVVGSACLVLGLAVVVHPSFLSSLTTSDPASQMEMGPDGM